MGVGRLTFFLPKGGSLQRASRLPRPCCAQVLARSRLTWRGRTQYQEEQEKGGWCDATLNRFSLNWYLIF